MNQPVRKRTRRSGQRAAVHVSSTKTSGGQEVSTKENISKEFESVVTDPNPAYVGVNGGMTINTGNYESIKIGVSVSMPCEPNDDGVREAYAKASELVEEFMDEEYREATSEEA